MTVYVFRCRTHGPFERSLPMSSSRETLQCQDCDQCGETAGRDFIQTQIVVPFFFHCTKSDFEPPSIQGKPAWSSDTDVKEYRDNTYQDRWI